MTSKTKHHAALSDTCCRHCMTVLGAEACPCFPWQEPLELSHQLGRSVFCEVYLARSRLDASSTWQCLLI